MMKLIRNLIPNLIRNLILKLNHNLFLKLNHNLFLIVTVTVALSISMLSACRRDTGSAVTVAGSTSVQPYAEVLAEAFAAGRPDAIINVQGGGSSAGISAALSGAADIGMSSRELTDEESALWYVEIAKDGLVIVVHPDNPLANLTPGQACGIYSGEITRWSEIDDGVRSDAKIHVITREEGSGTRSAFESMVMGSVPITPKALVQDSNGAVRQLVSSDINAIGFISLGLADPSVKALWLDGVMPTEENVMNGSYTLHRPFIFVSLTEPTGLTRAFIDFTISPEGRRILEAEGLVVDADGPAVDTEGNP